MEQLFGCIRKNAFAAPDLFVELLKYTALK